MSNLDQIVIELDHADIQLPLSQALTACRAFTDHSYSSADAVAKLFAIAHLSDLLKSLFDDTAEELTVRSASSFHGDNTP